MKKVANDQSEEWMQEKLRVLQDVSGSARTPEAENAGRARFLSEAAALRRAAMVRPASRLNGWATLISFISGKQARLAFSAVAAVCIVMALLLASGGTLVYAAQGSQPNQVLYPVKLFSEDVRLGLANDTQSQFDLNLEFANRRLDEIDKLSQAGQEAGIQVTDRLQNELDAALDSAASLDNSGAVKALENLQANLLKHQAHLLKLQTQANPHAVANYTRVVEMLQLKVDQAALGIKDPQSIRKLLKQEKQEKKELKKSSGDTPTLTVEMNNEEAAGTPPAAATGSKNNPAQCNSQGNGNNNNSNNGNNCPEPNVQATDTPVHGPAVTHTPKPNNPNQPVKTQKNDNNGNNGDNGDNDNNGNKGGNGHKK
jgi:hypothetical protein